MKPLIILILSLSCLGIIFPYSSFASTPLLSDISSTLKFVETRGDRLAIGDDGSSYGILQIQKAAIDDVNKHFGTTYIHEDAFDESCSEEIFFYYLNLGIKRFIKKYGKRPSEQDIVRMWNGGIYQGFRYRGTIKYYKRYLKWKKIN